MFGIHDYAMFAATAFLLNLTPGPDTMYILGRSLAQGRRSGFASVFGISTGCLVHTIAAAFGLSAILLASATAFAFVKFVGAAYLIYLGIQMLRSKTSLEDGLLVEKKLDYSAIFRQGVLTNVLNPKVALFFLALMPQFVDKNNEDPAIAFLVLGLTFVTMGTLWCCCLVYFATFLNNRIRQSPRASTWISRGTGFMFLGLGVRLAVSEKP